MSSSKLIRWSGLSAIVGGALIAVFNVLEFVLFSGQPQSDVVTSNAWIFVEIGYLIAEILLILGLVGFFAHQVDKIGNLGLIGFVIATAGTVLVSGTDWSAAFFGPWLASVSPGVLEAEPPGMFAVGILISILLFALGYFLFGLASFQARVLPRGSTMLLMVGAVLTLVFSLIELPFEVLLFGIAVAWMGYALWSRTGIHQG